MTFYCRLFTEQMLQKDTLSLTACSVPLGGTHTDAGHLGVGGVNKQVPRSGSQLFTKQQCKAPGELRGDLIPHCPTQLLHLSPKRILIIHTSANLTCILKPERCENMAIFMKTKQRISKEHPTQTRAKHHVSASALPCPHLLSQVASPPRLLP